MSRPVRPADESGSIVLGWLTKLVVVIGLFGLVAFDGVSLATAHFRVADGADAAARAAADDWAVHRDVQKAYDAAVAALRSPDDTVETATFAVLPGGGIDLQVDTTATTVLLHRVGPLRPWTQVRAPGHAGPP